MEDCKVVVYGYQKTEKIIWGMEGKNFVAIMIAVRRGPHAHMTGRHGSTE